jgi:hypothetical protein
VGEAERRVAAISRRQHGCFTIDQAVGAGLSQRQVLRRVEQGWYVRYGLKSFRIAGIDPGPLTELHGLVLDIGPPVWVMGPTAAALHGFDGFVLRPRFHLSIGRDRSVRRTGHLIHRVVEMSPIDRTRISGIAVTSAARTVVDLAAICSVEQLVIAIDSGLRDRKFDEALLVSRAEALAARGRVGIKRLMKAIHGDCSIRGGHSWLEREYLKVIAAAGLPRPETQVVLAEAHGSIVRVDAHFPGTRIVGEVLGYRFHRTESQMSRDAERMNALLREGYLPVQHTYSQVVDHPDQVVADLRAALSA